jgi:hypothetical protein
MKNTIINYVDLPNALKMLAEALTTTDKATKKECCKKAMAEFEKAQDNLETIEEQMNKNEDESLDYEEADEVTLTFRKTEPGKYEITRKAAR